MKWPLHAVVFALLAGTAPAQETGLLVRVLTYNIHHGEGMDRRIDLPRIARVIGEARPDLVALQEVHAGTRLAKGLDQAAELGRLTGMEARFAEAMPYQGGSYGEAVLSRWPILTNRTIALPATAGHEPRAAAEIRVRSPAGELVFTGTHLDHVQDPENRMRQAGALLAAQEGDGATPAILAGDLNCGPGSAPYRLLERVWASAWGGAAAPSWPADGPARDLDHVLVRPAGRWRVLEVRVLGEAVASDHRPVLAVLELLPAR